MGSTKKRKSYTPEYRREAVHMVIDTDRTIAEVAAELDLGVQLLGRWVQQERARMGTRRRRWIVSERAELERLRKENADLKLDNQFLGKAAAFLDMSAVGVARSRYHEWRKRRQAGTTAREQRMAVLVEKVKAHHEASDVTYGAPRIHADLQG